MSYKNIKHQFWLLYFALVTKIVIVSADFDGESALQEFIICRHCGADVADSYYLYNHLSPESVVYPRQSLFGKEDIKVQELINPYGIKFQIINTSKALCTGIGDWHNAHSWYPGFAWRHCVCVRCGTQLGWIFEPVSSAGEEKTPSKEGFYGLIVDNILSETLTNSLMIVPELLKSE